MLGLAVVALTKGTARLLLAPHDAIDSFSVFLDRKREGGRLRGQIIRLFDRRCACACLQACKRSCAAWRPPPHP